MNLESGTLFHNHYTLEKLIGRGGFSEVWLARDKYTQLEIALKIYAPGGGMDSNGIDVFSQEIGSVYNINHTNVLKPQHFDVCEGMPYLVLPYCPQGSCMKKVGNMSELEIWKMLKDVAAGLEYLHSKGIIHQDIKPDNILINSDGEYMLTDFGISTKARSTLRKSMMQNSVEDAAGTMAYMGPERFGKTKSAVKASDIWALGATVFELMTGDVPFGDGVIGGGLLQKSGAELPDMPDIYSQSLKSLVVQMLSLETWDRPTASGILEYLNKNSSASLNFTIGEKPKGPDKLVHSRPNKFSKPIVISLVALVVIVGIVAAIFNFGSDYNELQKRTEIRDSYVVQFQSELDSASIDNIVALEKAYDYLQKICEIENDSCMGDDERNKCITSLHDKISEINGTVTERYNDAVSGSTTANRLLDKKNKLEALVENVKLNYGTAGSRDENFNIVTDCQGHTYPVVKIGNQYWMAENLQCTKYDTQSERAGATLLTYSGSSDAPYYKDGKNATTGRSGELTSNYRRRLGLLYNWAAAVGLATAEESDAQTSIFSGKRQGICPNGWHIPTDAEWNALGVALGGTKDESDDFPKVGRKLKTTLCWHNNGNGTDDYSFAALPAGSALGNFVSDLGAFAFFWTATPEGSLYACRRYLDYSNDGLFGNISKKDMAESVRCVKN